MAEIKKATGVIDWLDQRLAVKVLAKVLMTEYWIPKNIKCNSIRRNLNTTHLIE